MKMDLNIIKNVGWRFAETMGAQLVSFVVSIVLARIISPEDYGVIAVVIIFINIANVFAESGLGTSLIQKKEIDNKDFSTIFYFNIIFSIFIYGILFIFAPLISNIYHKSQISNLIRVLGLRIIFSSLNSVQKAYVSKTMQFKKFFYSTLIGTVLSGICGIWMALLGYGAWALVFQYLINVITDSIVLWFTVKWRPNKYFSLNRLRSLFSFGSRILFTSLINESYIQFKSIVIGTRYNTTELAYFNRGQQLPAIITTGLNTAINSVMFPLMSSYQDEINEIRKILGSTIQMVSFFVIQTLVFLLSIAPTLIPFLMTDKWNYSVIYLQMACVNNVLVILQSSYIESFKAIGKINTFVIISWVQKVMGIILILMFLVKGPYIIILVEIVVNMLVLLITVYKVSTEIGYKISRQVTDILPSIISSIILMIFIYPINFININYTFILIIQFVFSVLIILFTGRLLKNPVLMKIIRRIKA